MSLSARIKEHEQLRLHVYDDKTGQPIGPGSVVQGHPTIGYGRCLDDSNGITKDEAEMLFATDMLAAGEDVSRALPWAASLNEARQGVLVEMAFNLGIGKLLKFTLTLDAVRRGDYAAAAEHMLDSKWAKQVGGRANTLAQIMRTGVE